ncbi:MAG: serine/threonine protein kinase [Myxococcales bacterium]|nr:serine/threonine protein kinase [Myxococcales bacterium]
MGEVYRAIDTGLNRRVAIKILSEKHRDSQELRQRFVREGRAVAAISHPNVVQVFATGTFDDRPYIAMELLDGTDLGSTVEKSGPLSSLDAAHAVLDAAQGLAAASKAGLIHRDVKPSNLVRLADGRVKVTDFGLAKPVDPGSEPALTAMGVVVGTPDYIAPEQARGEQIDERVDIYALGGTLYFLLTGIPPFRTGKPSEDKYLKVVARHLRNPPPEAAVTNPSVDRALSDLARQMMAKKPMERPSYGEATQVSSEILARLDPSAVPQMMTTRERSRPIVIPDSDNGAALSSSATTSDGALDVPQRAFPAWLVMLTLACVGLFVAGLVVYLMRDGKSAATAPADPGSATAAAPVVPAGMLLVKRPNGTPWFFVDAKPVSANALHALFADHVQAGDDPVVMVSYDEARSYAKSNGGRLLKSEEWDAAAQVRGFVTIDGLFEWVESPEGKRLVRGTVRSESANVGERGQTKSQTRPDKDQKDVSFRMAKDI